jgi:hypothetical protein
MRLELYLNFPKKHIFLFYFIGFEIITQRQKKINDNDKYLTNKHINRKIKIKLTYMKMLHKHCYKLGL